VAIAGLVGNQSPFKNIAPTMVWVIGWVGLSFASALIGDIWIVVNPWDSLARLVWVPRWPCSPASLSGARPIEGAGMSKIAPCLWFDGAAEEAASFYVSLLPDSQVDKIVRSPADTPSDGHKITQVLEVTSGTHHGRQRYVAG